MIIQKRRIEILGCPIDNLTIDETISLIDEMISSNTPHQHVVINVDKLLKLRNDKKLKQIISDCDIINVDGMPIVWASKILGNPLKERITGIDLMEQLIKHSVKKGYRVYFLGAKEEVVKKVVEVYSRRYPNLKIAGFRNGYWKFEEEEYIIKEIQKSKPDILFLAISSPTKEFFLKKFLNIMNVPFVMGVGGSFDVVAGVTKRAPLFMQKYGLEWFFRFIQEPKRMWKRYIIGNSVFICLIFKELLKKIFKKRLH